MIGRARFAFQKERPAQGERKVDRHRQAAVGHVALGVQPLLNLVDRSD